MNVLFKLCQFFLVVYLVIVFSWADKTEKCDLCTQLVQDFIDVNQILYQYCFLTSV